MDASEDASDAGARPDPVRVTGDPVWPWGALVAVALWGASFVAVRIALEGFHPVGLTVSRLVLAWVFLQALLLRRGEGLLPRSEDLGRCVLLGAIFGVHLAIQAYGLTATSAIHTGWIIGFTPVTIALGGWLFLGHRLSALGWWGVGLGAVGVLAITLEELPRFEDARLGDVLQLTSCVTWTAYTLLGVGVVERNGAMKVTSTCMLTASLLLLLPALGFGFAPLGSEESVIGGVAPVLAVLYLGIGCSGVALTLWFVSQRRHGPQKVGATLYLEPFFTLVVASLLLQEAITPRALAGGAVVLLGVWFVGRGSRRG